jgi:hypothetical protein
MKDFYYMFTSTPVKEWQQESPSAILSKADINPKIKGLFAQCHHYIVDEM